MSIWDRFRRRFFIKRYVRHELLRIKDRYTERLKSHGNLSAKEREDIETDWQGEATEYSEWLEEIECQELIKKAERMDIFLDAIQIPSDPANEGLPSHFERGQFGSRYLRSDSRRLLVAAIRERAPAYRKERRESWALFLQVIVVLSGLVGTITGLVLAWKRK